MPNTAPTSFQIMFATLYLEKKLSCKPLLLQDNNAKPHTVQLTRTTLEKPAMEDSSTSFLFAGSGAKRLYFARKFETCTSYLHLSDPV